MLTAILISTLLAAPPAAKAATPPKAPAAAAKEEGDAAKAKELFQSAQKLYKQSRYAEAIARFEEAYAARPHPVIYFNIGKCWEQLGETAKAMRAYRDYLRLSPNAQDKDTVSESIVNLERRLKEKGLQQVLVYADPSNARVEIDGKDLGTSPASIELVTGNHKLLVKADGYESADRSFVVQAGRSVEMTISLRPSKDTPPLPPPPPPPVVDVPKSDLKQPTKTASLTPTTPVDNTPVVVQPVKPAKKGKVFTWVAAGVAVAGVGAGVGMGLASKGASDELMTKDQAKIAARTRDQATGLQNTATSMATGANVSYGVAAAAAVAAVVLFFVEGR